LSSKIELICTLRKRKWKKKIQDSGLEADYKAQLKNAQTKIRADVGPLASKVWT
jgi:hypothetical protein